MQKIILYIKTHKFMTGIVAVILLGGAIFTFKGNGEVKNTINVEKKDFIKSVSINGKVVPAQNVDLSFDNSGIVTGVYKKVGDKVGRGQVIAVLDSRELQASKERAKAEQEAEEAELAKLKSGEKSDDTEVLSIKREIVSTIIESYTKADDAVRGKVDQYFENPRTYPEIKYTFEDSISTRKTINQKRALAEDALTSFAEMNKNLSVANYDEDDYKRADKYIKVIKDFLDTLSFAVNSFESSSDLPQSTIDKYRNDLSTARSNISAVSLDLIAAAEKLRGSVSNIPVQEARVKAALAEVHSYDAQLSKMIIVAPFSGVISLQDAKVGQSVSSNEKIVSMISGGFEIEAFIPEVSIPGIKVGNPAKVNLDAYTGVQFDAVITHIDPGETEKDGVSNYKIKLTFSEPDERIKPGMTADISIETEKRSEVIIIPERAVVVDQDGSSVYIKLEEGSQKRKIVTGEKDGRGNVEVIEGLQISEEVFLDPVSK